jgi:hypothetical protein
MVPNVKYKISTKMGLKAAEDFRKGLLIEISQYLFGWLHLLVPFISFSQHWQLL